MSQPRLVKNTIYITGALIGQKILSLIYFWLVSNSIAPQYLGQYVFALSYATLFSIFIDLGLSSILTREASKDQTQAQRYLSAVMALKIPLAIIAILVALIGITFSGKIPAIQHLVYLACIVIALDSFSLTFWVMFRSRHTLMYESLSMIAVQIIIFSCGVTALKTTGEVSYLMLALVIASIFNFCLSGTLVKRKLGYTLKPQWQLELIKEIIVVLPAFALAGIFVKIYNTADSVLLSYLSGDHAVGLFAVPAKIVYALQQIIPAAFATAMFPTFSYYFKHSRTLLEKTFLLSCKYLLTISIPLAAGLVVLATTTITVLWPNYIAVIPTFIVMGCAIPFIFLAFPTGYLLNACHRQGHNTMNRGIITVLSVILNVILIMRYNYLGAGITFLVTNIILVGLDAWRTKSVISMPWRALSMITIKTIAAASIMVSILMLITPYLLNHVGKPVLLIAQVILGASSYVVALYALKGFSIAEIKEALRPTITVIDEENKV